jgi:hypothetical protein
VVVEGERRGRREGFGCEGVSRRDTRQRRFAAGGVVDGACARVHHGHHALNCLHRVCAMSTAWPDGDRYVIVVECDGGERSPAVSGWTKIGEIEDGSNSTLAAFAIVGSSRGATSTVTGAAAHQHWQGAAVRFSGTYAEDLSAIRSSWWNHGGFRPASGAFGPEIGSVAATSIILRAWAIDNGTGWSDEPIVACR